MAMLIVLNILFCVSHSIYKYAQMIRPRMIINVRCTCVKSTTIVLKMGSNTLLVLYLKGVSLFSHLLSCHVCICLFILRPYNINVK